MLRKAASSSSGKKLDDKNKGKRNQGDSEPGHVAPKKQKKGAK